MVRRQTANLLFVGSIPTGASAARIQLGFDMEAILFQATGVRSVSTDDAHHNEARIARPLAALTAVQREDA